ncbi:MAG: AMP-binding protein [Candidatus Cloacimonetes bacterium]|nr:AMP-binding protein [Candidatus Cloacimonadota bacterium]
MQLHLKFVETAKKMGKKTAVIDTATQKTYNYNLMLIASLILKNRFDRIEGKYLGIMLPTSAGCHLGVLATLMSGKIPVMINYSTGAIENSIYAQEKCGFESIITSKKLLLKLNLEPLETMIYIEDILESVSKIDKLAAAIQSKLPYPLLKNHIHKGDDEDTCVILFTSGSEKDPKAVQLTHANITHNISVLPDWMGMHDDEIFGGTLPLFHVFGLTATFWLPLLMGSTVVTFANPLDYKLIVEKIKEHKITVMIGTPTFFAGYLKRSEKGDFDSVRFAVTGADKLNDKLRLTYLEEHGLQVMEGYGATETSPVISLNSFTDYRPGSIGKPVPGVEVKIIDPKTDKELAAGETGKVMVRGAMVMKGYLGDVEETMLHIRNGWYDTGDMGMVDKDGFLWHKGRLKRFVKVGGEMVSLVRTEELLTALLPEGVYCCVVDVPNPLKGADVVAAVATGDFDQKHVLHELKKQLPAIAVPKEFYVIADIPLMGSGKVNFREVENICRQMQKKNK